MLNILIVDDEKHIRMGLVKMLNLINPEYHVIGEAASIKEAKRELAIKKPDVLFLDIELKDGTGFDLLNQLPTINFKVIFITAFNQYAIKAFKFNALDYLLKPVDPNELIEALIKVQERVQIENELKKIAQNIEDNKSDKDPKIVIKTNNRTHFVSVSSILYCQSDGAYTKLVTEKENILASKNLKHFQDLLDEYDFLRTHQSYLVNKAFIAAYKNDTIYLFNELEIPVSTRKRVAVKNVLLNK